MVISSAKKLWKHRADIIVFENTVNESTGVVDTVKKTINSDVPCHLRYHYYLRHATNDEASSTYQRVSLFISKDIDIPPGSHVVVRKLDSNYKEEFEYAGLPSVYSAHKQVPLAVINRRT